MMDLVAAINININPEIFGGGLTLTWHGFFTAVGIALGVWLSIRLARRVGIPEDDAFTIALVAVPSGIVGARVLWILEHTDLIHDVGDIFALNDGGISVYGAMIGGVLGGFTYVLIWKPHFPRWLALDIAAPGMILGQAVGRLGDTINGEHFARGTDLPWAFRYTNPNTEGPWASIVDGVIPSASAWVRGQTGALAEAPVPVHPVAGGYELILDFAILGGLLLLRRTRLLPGWGFIFYVLSYAAVRGSLAILRSDEQTIVGDLSVPQLLAVVTAGAAAVMAYYIWRNPPDRPAPVEVQRQVRRDEARERRHDRAEPGGGKSSRSPRAAKAGPGGLRVRKRRDPPA
jgi:phosphatidylglycerol:prolipoprotein diacylglycerol transferase